MSAYLTELRAQIGPRKVILAYATALIRDWRGRILFQRRADFDWWGLPGGLLELGETLGACAVREAREETGLRVRPTRLVGVYAGPPYDVVYPNGDQVQQWTAAFACQAEEPLTNGRPDGGEALEQAFFAPEALPATSPWYADMVRDLLAERPGASFAPPRPAPTSVDAYSLTALRGLVGPRELILPAAGAIIHDDAGRVLLIQRGDNGQWGFPGGLMDLGETIAETVVRETREETGLAVTPTRLIGAYSGPDYRIVYPNGDRVQVCSTVFACRVIGGTPVPDGVETLAVRFFPLDALPTPMPERVRRRLAEAVPARLHALFV